VISKQLSFTREVEIIASTVAPPATTHTFSFSVPPTSAESASSAPGAVGNAWDLSIASAAAGRPSLDGHVTYYAATLTIWSHADRPRSEAIRQAVETGSRAKSAAVARAVKAAAAGRRLGQRLERRMENPMGVSDKGFAGKAWATSGGETETETDAYVSESEWEQQGVANANVSSNHLAFLPQSVPFWLPYTLTLVSRYPIYDCGCSFFFCSCE
jgi:hypothetical protein